jgi:glycosyltransferase involved in cell wall biosynthesis
VHGRAEQVFSSPARQAWDSLLFSGFGLMPGHARDPTASRKISVVIPAYNESRVIEKNLAEVVRALRSLGYDFEVIVVDDGSPDNTHVHAARARSAYPEHIRVVRYDKNCGKGNALMCGTRCASGNHVAFLDADLDLHPEQLGTFLEIMDREKADVVIGSKRHPQSRVNYPTERRIYSTVYHALVWLLFGLPVRDTQIGLKLFKIEVLHQVFPRILVKRFAFDIEVLANAHRLGYRIVEAPVRLSFQRPKGRIKWRDIYEIAIDTLAIFYRMHVLKD